LSAREPAPEIRFLDARAAGVDEPGLRDLARALTAASGAAFATRSYRHPYALVAWHSLPVGADLERIEACDGAFAESIRTPAERAAAGGHALSEAQIASLWCSKEALAKALGDARRYDPRRLESPMGWPDGSAGPWRAAPVPVARGHVAWLCWRSVAVLLG
jgi:hypothetical protein